LQQPETPRPADRRNREITKPGQPSVLKRKDEAWKKMAKAKKMMEDIRKTGAEMKKKLQET